jgi:hypothetical protein
MESDTATFFDIDIPALLEWQFTAADAGHVTAPVLYVGGTNSGPMFAEVRNLMMEWLPQAEEVMIRGQITPSPSANPPRSPPPWLPFFSATTYAADQALEIATRRATSPPSAYRLARLAHDNRDDPIDDRPAGATSRHRWSPNGTVSAQR